MLQANKGSVYSPRKSQKDVYLKYVDDGKCQDVGPAMIILKDEEVQADDRIDSPFPTAFSPTLSYSLDIDLDIEVSGEEKQNEGMADLYAKVVPKLQRPKEEDSKKKDTTPVSNGKVAISVDPHSQYATVVPKSQRSKPAKETTAVANGKPTSNGLVTRSDNHKLKAEARSKVLSAIGSEPILIRSDDNEISYRKNVPTAQRIESALGNKALYRESAEL